MFDEILNKKNELVREKYELIKKLKLIEEEITSKKNDIAKLCKTINNGHKWITVRENGLYGEKFTFCKFCKINLYGNSFYE